MKVELKFKNQLEFIEFVKSMNNAIIAYNDIVNSIALGCEVSTKWDLLIENTTDDILCHRVRLLKEQYDKLCKVEDNLTTVYI